MSAGTGNFAYRVTRMIPESWAGIINFIFNRLVRWISPQQETNLKGFLSTNLSADVADDGKGDTIIGGALSNLSFTRSSPYATDIISKGNSKLSGIVKVADRYGFELDEVMVFGDSNNDFEMLNEIQHSVAMGNGTKKVKHAASFVTDTNNRDGIYKALIHFGVIEG